MSYQLNILELKYDSNNHCYYSHQKNSLFNYTNQFQQKTIAF